MLSKKFYTPQEVADYWGVSDVTVLGWIHQGKLSAAKIGSLYRLTEADITAFERVLPVKKEATAV